MSFRNPFKGHHAPKKSAISVTAEREFAREVKKLELLDGLTKEVNKDSKRGVEKQTEQSKCELRMTESLMKCHLSQDDDSLRQLVEDWNAAVLRLDLLTSELNTNLLKTVIEPMKKLSSVFPATQIAVKKRDQSLQAYTNCQQKHEKLQKKERTGQNLVRLEESNRALMAARDNFAKQNSMLLEDLPKFYERRVEYVQPSLQALIKSKVNYYTDVHQVYSELSQRVNGDHAVNDEQGVEQKLAEIRALSITTDD